MVSSGHHSATNGAPQGEAATAIEVGVPDQVRDVKRPCPEQPRSGPGSARPPRRAGALATLLTRTDGGCGGAIKRRPQASAAPTRGRALPYCCMAWKLEE